MRESTLPGVWLVCRSFNAVPLKPPFGCTEACAECNNEMVGIPVHAYNMQTHVQWNLQQWTLRNKASLSAKGTA